MVGKGTSASSDAKSSKATVAAPAISYKLSSEVFKNLGWTNQPENAIAVPMVMMRAKFSHPVLSTWFVKGRGRIMKYKNGNTLCVAKDDGTGRIYYPNGKVAVEIRETEKNRSVTRVIVNTPGGVGRDGVLRPSQLCAIFDSLGQGVVYDCDKRKRLVYDQNHGIAWLHRNSVPIYWRWHRLTFIESLMEIKPDEKKLDNKPSTSFSKKESLIRRQSNATPYMESVTTIRGRKKSGGEFLDTAHLLPQCPIKPIVFQINRYIGLRIYSQSKIALTFFAECNQTRLNIGVLYNPYKKMAQYKVPTARLVEKVICPFEVLPADTKSMINLKERIAQEKTISCWNMC